MVTGVSLRADTFLSWACEFVGVGAVQLLMASRRGDWCECWTEFVLSE